MLSFFKFIILFSLITGTALAQSKVFIYAGLNEKKIAIFERDSADGSLTPAGLLELSDVPFYLERHPTHKILYVGLRDPEQGLAAYEMNPETGELTFINKISIPTGPVHISLDKSAGTIFTSPYSIPSVTLSPVNEDGSLVDSVTIIDTDEKPHAMQTDVSGKFLYIVTLASDKIHHYHWDAETRGYTPADPPTIDTKPGSGPRLFATHPNGLFMYLANELDNTVVAYNVDSKTGSLGEFQSLSTLPEGVIGGSSLSEIHLTPDNKFLYIANRSHSTIVGYSVNQQSGNLTYIDHFTTERNVRSFTISPDGRHLYAGSRKSDVIEIFIIDDVSGELVKDTDLPSGGDPVMMLAVDMADPVVGTHFEAASKWSGSAKVESQSSAFWQVAVGGNKNKVLELIDLNGSQVFRIAGQGRSFKVDKPSDKGLYILRVQVEKGPVNFIKMMVH
jgi:6-phosphogluconolactonase